MSWLHMVKYGCTLLDKYIWVCMPIYGYIAYAYVWVFMVYPKQ